jgi:outer membrane protein
MKKSILKITLACIALVCLSFGRSDAQVHKLGHLNFQELVVQMPEYTKANSDMEVFGKQLEDELKKMSAELQKKADEFQKQEPKMAEAIKEMKEKELQDMQSRIQQFQQSAQQNVRKKEEELLKPIYEKAKKAIADVAKENGYSYIFDAGPGSPVLYKPESENVTSQVSKKLGVVEKKETPPPAPPKK